MILSLLLVLTCACGRSNSSSEAKGPVDGGPNPDAGDGFIDRRDAGLNSRLEDRYEDDGIDDTNLIDPNAQDVGRELGSADEVEVITNPFMAEYHELADRIDGYLELVFGPESADLRWVRFTIEADDVETSSAGDVVELPLVGVEVSTVQEPVGGESTTRLVLPSGDLVGLDVLVAYERRAGAFRPTQAVLLDARGSGLGAGPIVVATQPILTTGQDCVGAALMEVSDLPRGSLKLPKDVKGCGLERCTRALVAFIQGQHHVWRAYQAFEYMGERSRNHQSHYFSQGGLSASGIYSGPSTLWSHWFGSYADHRFDAIRQVVKKTWDRFRSGKVGPLRIDLVCPSATSNPGDPCFTGSPSAHHIVISQIALCDRYFDPARDDQNRARVMIHEVLHHIWVSWNGGVPRLDPVQDTHTHGHGQTCLGDLTTHKIYGPNRVRHLATYSNSGGNHCFHRNLAFRANDAYAYAISSFGDAIMTGAIAKWPASHPFSPGPSAPCTGVGVTPPAPGDTWGDALSECNKIGQETICEGGSGGSASGSIPPLNIGVQCPAQP